MKNEKKFLEVLSEVVKELMQSSDEKIEDTEKRVVENLVRKGYDLEEISETLEEIFENMDIIKEQDLKMRVLHPAELSNFSDESREYFISLKNTGIIDEFEFEDILNYFHNYDEIIELDVLKFLLKKKGILSTQIIN